MELRLPPFADKDPRERRDLRDAQVRRVLREPRAQPASQVQRVQVRQAQPGSRDQRVQVRQAQPGSQVQRVTQVPREPLDQRVTQVPREPLDQQVTQESREPLGSQAQRVPTLWSPDPPVRKARQVQKVLRGPEVVAVGLCPSSARQDLEVS